MAKRSPILGYNHNVRYRGLIWHVQTEDSGLQNPHLFTHLFHEGVIVSTRKLVYDAGSDEGAIKSLMQAQHKAVMKDLKKGYFDDKIDLYFDGTSGLLPRGGVEEAAPERPSEIALPAPTLNDIDPPTLRQDEPIVLPRADRDAVQTHQTRTVTADLTSAPSQIKSTLLDPAEELAATTTTTTKRQLASVDSSAEIEIRLELDDSGPVDTSRTSSSRRRTTHDTEISVSEVPTMSDVPGMVIDDATRPNLASEIPGHRGHGESIPPLPPPPEKRPTGDRPAVGAASLPPARPIARPPSRPAMTPPTVVSRPLTEDPARKPRESDAVEVYAPAPPSADAPPGMAERPGQYAQHRRSTGAIPADIVRDRDRPSAGPPVPTAVPKPRPASSPIPRVVQREASPPPPHAIPQVIRHEPSGATSGPARSRTLTPARIPSPAAGRTGTPGASGGVVMTRPAVIVGAPAKPATTQRVRKAREEEGRGFGQGLISEKSLDEVILAYLSEDADDK